VRDVALAAVFLSLIVFAFKRPWVGLLIWSWLSYMNPHRFTFGFAHYFPFVAITAGITILSWVVSSQHQRFPWTRETILEVLLCIWIFITTVFAINQVDLFYPDLPNAWDNLSRALKIQVMIFMTYLIIKNRYQLNALVWVIVGSIGFFGLKGGVFAFLTGGSDMVIGPPETMIDGNNEIALAMVMVLPLMRYLQINAKSRWMRWGLLGAQITTTLAILSTYSRGGFLALSVVGFLLWLKSRKKLALAVIMLLVVPPLIQFMPQKWEERMHTISTDRDELDESSLGRINAWGFAWNLAKAHPVMGGGFRVFYVADAWAQYAPIPRDWHDSHSIYFEMLAEHGFVGLALFLALGISTALTGRWVIRTTRTIPELTWIRDLVAMTQVGLAGFAVGGTFAGLAFFDLPYHMMSIIVLCSVFVKQYLRTAAESELEADNDNSQKADLIYAVE